MFFCIDKGSSERKEEIILLLFYQKQTGGDRKCWSGRCWSGKLGLRMSENVGLGRRLNVSFFCQDSEVHE